MISGYLLYQPVVGRYSSAARLKHATIYALDEPLEGKTARGDRSGGVTAITKGCFLLHWS
jgi:hypothetical protein